MSGHSFFWTSIIWKHLLFFCWYKQILRPLFVHCNLSIWKWYPWFLLLSFEILMILVQWKLRKTLNRLLQYHLGVQLDLCTFGALPPIHINDMSINDATWTFPPDVFASSITSFFAFDFRQVPRRNFLQFFTFLVHRCFRCRNFHSFRHRN